jgi:aminoglycoside phosphotransferase (APT) family kinase protein
MPPWRGGFFRGGPLATYESEAVEAIEALGGEIPRSDVERVWEDAMRTTWDRDPVWLHGDVAAGNLLVRDGRLTAVIDFGTSGIGDPACDMVIA